MSSKERFRIFNKTLKESIEHAKTDTELMMLPFVYQTIKEREPNWEIIDVVRAEIENMSPQDQNILEFIFSYGQTYEKLTEELNIKAKSHAWRKTRTALKRLSDRLMQNEEFLEKAKQYYEDME
jgi:hypothetical protein